MVEQSECTQCGDKAFTVEEHDPPHDDFKALSEDYKKAILSRVKFLGLKKVAMRFKLFLELVQLNKLLIPSVQIQIQMYFKGHSLDLQRADGPDDRRKIMSYHTARDEIRTYTHPAQDWYFKCNNQLPNQVIVTMLRQDAFIGDKTRYPFPYQKFNLASIKQLVRGEEFLYETLELQHDIDNKDLRGYHRFLKVTGRICRMKGWKDGDKAETAPFLNLITGLMDA